MKLAISNIAWSSEFDEEVYIYLQQKGIKGLEIAPTRIFPQNPYHCLEEATEFRANIAKQFELEVVSMQSIWFGKTANMFDSYESLTELKDYTKLAIDFANSIGSKNLVFGSPKNRNIGPNAIISLHEVVDFFQVLGEYCKIKETVLSIEPNPSIYGTNFINTTEEAIELVKQINHPNIKVNLDLGTVIENNEEISTCISHINLIHHVHISEPYLEAIINREIHKELIRGLVNKSYDGYISIEMKNLNNINQVKSKIDYLDKIIFESKKEN